MKVRSANLAHEATSAHACALYPFVADSGVWAPGVYIGQDWLGGNGAFCYDPWQLCASEVITGSNACMVGMPGKGKSALRKAYILRQVAFGREAVILDPKGEDGPLCRLLGVEPIRLAPGGGVRLNPLDSRVGGVMRTDREVRTERLEMLYAVIGAVLCRPLTMPERKACRVGLAAAEGGVQGGEEPTLPLLARAMFAPDESAAAAVGLTGRQLGEASLSAALALEELVEGPLAGMFDGPTTPALRLGGPLTSFDLSALHGSEALGILTVCAAAWLQKLLCRKDGVKRILVLDEAWACLGSLPLAQWLRAAYKLAREYGYQCLVVLHRFSDLLAAGAEGSEQVAIARGLVADSETQILLSQSASEVATTRELLGLTDGEAAVLTGLPRGRALWRVGQRSFLVQLELSEIERDICETDGAMTDRAVATEAA